MTTTPLAAREAAQSPCTACPWRTANHSKKPDPDGWYTKANLLRLWNGLRTGDAPGMSCHPTDPRNPVSEQAKAVGHKEAPDHSTMRECAGSVILMQRELQIFNDAVEAGGSFADYRRGRPGAMTRQALFTFGMRLAVQFPGDLPLRRDHNLNEPISVPGKVPWTNRKEQPA